jgi:choline dehydrogenase-like flavoprotein
MTVSSSVTSSRICGTADLVRFLGGSTNHWHGMCPRLDPIDFERLPDRPYSGWPFGFATLAPFYERACRYCEITAFNQDLPPVDATIGRLLEGSELQLTEFRSSTALRTRHDATCL